MLAKTSVVSVSVGKNGIMSLADLTTNPTASVGQLQQDEPCQQLKIKNGLIHIKQAGEYIISAKVNVQRPNAGFVLQLINAYNNEVVASAVGSVCPVAKLHYREILPKGLKLFFKVVSKYDISDATLACSAQFFNICADEIEKMVIGKGLKNNVGASGETDQEKALRRATVFDQSWKSQYITTTPPQGAPPAPLLNPNYPVNAYNWTSVTFPWQQTESTNDPSRLPNDNYYDKFLGVQYSLFFYMDIDLFTTPETSPNITLFTKNFADRGLNNHQKKIYMSALVSELMPKYKPKIDLMLNEVYNKVTIDRAPVLSAFREVLIPFFISMHSGVDIYPDYVIEYFNTFINVVGFGDPTRPGRDAAMLRGNTLAPQVKAYLTARFEIVKTNDESCFFFYWHKGGLPVESLLGECLHNITAFSQFNHFLYLLIADKIWASSEPFNATETYGLPARSDTPVPYWFPPSPIPMRQVVPGIGVVGPVNFFLKMSNVKGECEGDRIDVVREAFRILVPNGNSFSRLQNDNVPIVDEVVTQSMLIWQQVMIANQPVPDNMKVASYYSYNVNKYIGFPGTFKTSDSCGYKGNSTANVSESLLDTYNPDDLFITSDIDNDPLFGDGTLIQKSNPNFQPIYSQPLYLPFGFAYRRCPGEFLNNYIGIKLIEKFAHVWWKVMPLSDVPDYDTYETLAPYKAVPNNIYMDRFK
jgi:hypothetical protein